MKILPVLIFAAGVIGVALVLRQQIRYRRSMPTLISARLVRIRVASGFLLLAMLAMLLFNQVVLAGRGHWVALYYWVGFLGLAVVMMAVTLMDFRELRRGAHDRQMQELERMLRQPPRDRDDDQA